MIIVVEVHVLNEVANETLSYRAKRASSGRSSEFIALLNGVECGLLSYEDWSDREEGFVYEIYVLSDFRKQGIGTALLSHAEDLAIKTGCTKIRLDARALDRETNQESLLSWYQDQGYIQESDGVEQMEKSLA